MTFENRDPHWPNLLWEELKQADNSSWTAANLTKPTIPYQKRLKGKIAFFSVMQNWLLQNPFNPFFLDFYAKKKTKNDSFHKDLFKLLLFSYYRKIPSHIAHVLVAGG